MKAPEPWPRAPRPEPPWAKDVPMPESIRAPAELPVARIARVSLWRRFVAWWHWRSKAELLALVEHQRGLLAGKEREIERLEIRLAQRRFVGPVSFSGIPILDE